MDRKAREPTARPRKPVTRIFVAQVPSRPAHWHERGRHDLIRPEFWFGRHFEERHPYTAHDLNPRMSSRLQPLPLRVRLWFDDVDWTYPGRPRKTYALFGLPRWSEMAVEANCWLRIV